MLTCTQGRVGVHYSIQKDVRLNKFKPEKLKRGAQHKTAPEEKKKGRGEIETRKKEKKGYLSKDNLPTDIQKTGEQRRTLRGWSGKKRTRGNSAGGGGSHEEGRKQLGHTHQTIKRIKKKRGGMRLKKNSKKIKKGSQEGGRNAVKNYERKQIKGKENNDDQIYLLTWRGGDNDNYGEIVI